MSLNTGLATLYRYKVKLAAEETIYVERSPRYFVN